MKPPENKLLDEIIKDIGIHIKEILSTNQTRIEHPYDGFRLTVYEIDKRVIRIDFVKSWGEPTEEDSTRVVKK